MSLSNAQIRDAFDLFDVQGSKKISREDAQLAVRGLGFVAALPKAQIESLIRTTDTDGDGYLTDVEFTQICKDNMPKPGSNEEIWQAYKLFDVEQKGRITADDLRAGAAGGSDAEGKLTSTLSEKDRQAILQQGEYPEKGLAFSEWKHMMISHQRGL
jgi:centrin-1